VQLYIEHRKQWRTNSPEIATFKGFVKKHSGEPFTIDFNTILNIAICGSIYDIDSMYFALFKGDDSLIACNNIELTDFGERKLLEYGMSTKINITDVAEFTGFIVTQYGVYPDYIRRVIKAFSKIYTDIDDFKEMQNAIYDYVSGVKSLKLQIEGREKLCEYYNRKLNCRQGLKQIITTQDIETIENFMYNFTRYNFDDCIKITKDSVSFPSQINL